MKNTFQPPEDKKEEQPKEITEEIVEEILSLDITIEAPPEDKSVIPELKETEQFQTLTTSTTSTTATTATTATTSATDIAFFPPPFLPLSPRVTRANLTPNTKVLTHTKMLSSAKLRVEEFKRRGYDLVGSLPSYEEIPTYHRGAGKMGRFLFKKDDRLFQINGQEFFKNSDDLPFDAKDELLKESSFKEIIDGDFCYYLAKEVNPLKPTEINWVLFIKEGVEQGGHWLLSGSYGRKCGLLTLSKPLSDYTDKDLIPTLSGLLAHPKAAFVFSKTSVAYLIYFKGALHRFHINLSKEAVEALKVKIKLESELTVQEIDCVYTETPPDIYNILKFDTGFTPFFEAVAGEFFVRKSKDPVKKPKIILINNKSGNFHSNSILAQNFLSNILGVDIKEAYHPAIETEEVNRELARRIVAMDEANPTNFADESEALVSADNEVIANNIGL